MTTEDMAEICKKYPGRVLVLEEEGTYLLVAYASPRKVLSPDAKWCGSGGEPIEPLPAEKVLVIE